MKNKSVHSWRFVHHAKFHCIMTTLNKLFKIEFERGELERSQYVIVIYQQGVCNRYFFLSIGEFDHIVFDWRSGKVSGFCDKGFRFDSRS